MKGSPGMHDVNEFVRFVSCGRILLLVFMLPSLLGGVHGLVCWADCHYL
jgi:hypothetical protein